MKIKYLALAASLAAATTAAPTAPDEVYYFRIAIKGTGDSSVEGEVGAAYTGLFGNLDSIGAECANGARPGPATFALEKDVLSLYGGTGERQQVYVDRTGMGEGRISYIVGNHQAPENSEGDGWTVSHGRIQFKGNGLLSCPKGEDNAPKGFPDASTIWVDTGNPSPGGNEDCEPVEAFALLDPDGVHCAYSFKQPDDFGSALAHLFKGGSRSHRGDR